MNLILHIQESLFENGSVELPDFGIFTLKKKSAFLDEKTSKIIPPKYELFFVHKEKSFDDSFSKFIAKKAKKPDFIIEEFLKYEIRKWNNELYSNKELYVSNLGRFILIGERIVFEDGYSSLNITSDYFGLEEVDLIKITETLPLSPPLQKDYAFNRSWIWHFLLLLILASLIYWGVKTPESIFGNNSFIENKK